MIANLCLQLFFLFGQTSPSPEVDMRCGSYCLYLSLKSLDFNVPSYAEFEIKLGAPTVRGYSMEQLYLTAEEYGASTLPVVTTIEVLQRRSERFACIARIGTNHFVIISRVADGTAQIIDPPSKYHLPLDTLRTQWDGKALLVATGPLASEESFARLGLLPFGLGAGASLCAIIFGGTFLWRRKHRAAA